VTRDAAKNVDTRRPAVRCSARSSRSGERCRAFAVHGASVCVAHGGRAPQVRRKAAVNVARDRALAEARRLGGTIDVGPHEVLLDAVREAAANVEVLRGYVAHLGVEVAEDGAIALPEQRIEWEKGGTHVPARVHILLALYSEERDRLVRFSKLAIDAGVAERQVRVAEQQAQRLGQAFGRALDAAAEVITPDARAALQKALAVELRGLSS